MALFQSVRVLLHIVCVDSFPTPSASHKTSQYHTRRDQRTPLCCLWHHHYFHPGSFANLLWGLFKRDVCKQTPKHNKMIAGELQLLGNLWHTVTFLSWWNTWPQRETQGGAEIAEDPPEEKLMTQAVSVKREGLLEAPKGPTWQRYPEALEWHLLQADPEV
jgi:hypothetical protein